MPNMTTGGTTKHTVLFAIPLLFGSLLQQIYSMVDTVVVGRFVGYQALALAGAFSGIYAIKKQRLLELLHKQEAVLEW